MENEVYNLQMKITMPSVSCLNIVLLPDVHHSLSYRHTYKHNVDFSKITYETLFYTIVLID